MLSSFSKESGMAIDKLVFVWVLSLVMNLRLGYMVTPQMSRAGPWTMNTLIKPDQGNCQTMASSNFFLDYQRFLVWNRDLQTCSL